MAEKDLVLGGDESDEGVDFIDIIDETRLNMAEARENLRLFEDYNEDSSFRVGELVQACRHQGQAAMHGDHPEGYPGDASSRCPRETEPPKP
jgi:hypothetical protein